MTLWQVDSRLIREIVEAPTAADAFDLALRPHPPTELGFVCLAEPVDAKPGTEVVRAYAWDLLREWGDPEAARALGQLARDMHFSEAPPDEDA